MSRGNAIYDLKYLVKRKTGRRPNALRANCTRTSDVSFFCRAGFWVRGWRYKGSFRVSVFSGSDGTVYWTGNFRGRRSNGSSVNWSI